MTEQAWLASRSHGDYHINTVSVWGITGVACQPGFNTMMGTTVDKAMRRALDAGARVVGGCPDAAIPQAEVTYVLA